MLSRGVSATRRVLALPTLGAALTLIAFGVVRGGSDPGPASGERLVVAIDPPADAAAVAMAEHVLRTRIEDPTVIPAGDRIVVELGESDPEIVRMTIELIERTAKLEVRAADRREVAISASAIVAARIDDGGVAIELADPAPLARFRQGSPIEVALDGKIQFTGAIDRIAGGELHVPVRAEDARHLVDLIEAGAVHPLHVVSRTPFTRATGFVPRAWPFLAAGAVLLIVVALLWRRPRVTRP